MIVVVNNSTPAVTVEFETETGGINTDNYVTFTVSFLAIHEVNAAGGIFFFYIYLFILKTKKKKKVIFYCLLLIYFSYLFS